MIDLSAPVLLWLRRELRLTGNAALIAAMASGRPVVPVFVLDDASPGDWAPGGASRWWLHHSLAALGADLAAGGAPLVLRRGRFDFEIPRLAAEIGAVEVHAGLPAEPWARAACRLVAEAVRLRVHLTTLLHHPDAVRTQAGTPHGVFTPFGRACRALGQVGMPVPAPGRIAGVAGVASERLEDWRLLPTAPDWAGGLRDAWVPGEQGAQARLGATYPRPVVDLAAGRDRALAAFAALKAA